MELFTYLMAKNDHNTSVNKDLFSYLLGKNQSGTYTDYSGTSLSINNTKKGKMKVNLLGNTSQTGTPTPSSPIPVNVVSGDNTIVSTGKNLFNESVLNTYKVSEDSEAYIFNGNTLYNKNLTPNITFKPNTAYTIQYNAKQTSGNPRLAIVYTDGTRVGIGYNEYGAIYTYYDTYTITSNSSKTIDYISEDYGSNVSNNFYIKKGSVCIVEGNDTQFYQYTSTSYPIHLGEYELCKISTYQDGFIKTTGKNLFDNITTKQLITSNGTITNNDSWNLGDYIKVQPNTKYTFSRYDGTGQSLMIAEYNSSKTFIQRDTQGGIAAITPYTITTTATTEYVRLNYDNTKGNTLLQFELGNTATSYEPYGTNEWYLEKKIGKVVLDGSENWDIGQYGTNSYGLNIANMKRSINDTSNPIYVATNLFKGVSYNDRTTGNNIAYSETDFSYISLYIRNTSYTSLANFKTMLGTTNLIVYYVLATPTYTPITGNLKDELDALQKAQSYKGTTNINQINNDLPFNMDVSVKVGN